MNVNETCSWY